MTEVHVDLALMERLANENELEARRFERGTPERIRFEDMARGYRQAAERERLARQHDDQTDRAIEHEYLSTRGDALGITSKILLVLALICLGILVWINLPQIRSLSQAAYYGLIVAFCVLGGITVRMFWERAK